MAWRPPLQAEQKGTGHAVQMAGEGAGGLRWAGADPLWRHAVRHRDDLAADARPADRARQPRRRRAGQLAGRRQDLWPRYPRRGRPYFEDGRV